MYLNGNWKLQREQNSRETREDAATTTMYPQIILNINICSLHGQLSSIKCLQIGTIGQLSKSKYKKDFHHTQLFEMQRDGLKPTTSTLKKKMKKGQRT